MAAPFEKMHAGLEKAASSEMMTFITKILENINQLPDIGKLLLYLKLPKGQSVVHHHTGVEKNSESNTVLTNWIKTHLSECKESSLLKQDVYDRYRSFVEQQHLPCSSMTDFCKVLKHIYPNIRERRLGKRGNTKYVHSGIKFADEVPAYQTPEISVPVHLSKVVDSTCHDAERDANAVILEWAKKLLEKQFSGMTELAEFLIENNFVSPRTSEAFAVVAAAAARRPDGLAFIPTDRGVNVTGNDVHAQLRRNLQERELLGRLRSKMEEQRTVVTTCTRDRGLASSFEKPLDKSAELSASGTTNGTLLKAVPRRPRVCSPTPPKRILPKTSSANECHIQTIISNTTVDHMQSSSSVIHAAAPNTNGGAQFVLLSPNATQIPSPMALFNSPLASHNHADAMQPIIIAPATFMPKPAQSPQVTMTPNNKAIFVSSFLPASSTVNSSISQVSSCSTSVAGTARSLTFIENDVLNNFVSTEHGDAGHKANGSNDLSSCGLQMANPLLVTSRERGGSSLTKLISTVVEDRQKSQIPPIYDDELKMISADSFTDVSRLIDMFVDGKPLGNAENLNSCSSAVNILGSSHDAAKLSGSCMQNNQMHSSQTPKVPSGRKSSSSSKTVMSLLRENKQDENATGGNHKMYLKDPRPVACILKEERERRQLMSLPLPGSVDNVENKQVITQLSHPAGHLQAFVENKASLSTEDASLLKDLLMARTPAGSRRPSLERPLSVSELFSFETTRLSNEPSASCQSSGTDCITGPSRKRPHTALNDPLPMSGVWSDGLNIGQGLNIGLIEKSVLDDDFMDLSTTVDLKEEESCHTKSVSFVTSAIGFSSSFQSEIDGSEQPPAKLSFINRSAENMTFQQLQQARFRESFRNAAEKTKRPSADESIVPLLAGRPASLTGELVFNTFDGQVLRDSRPNTVVGLWQPTPTEYRTDRSSSVESCASVTVFQSSNSLVHFTPIHSLSEELPSTCDLVRPTAKIPTNNVVGSMPEVSENGRESQGNIKKTISASDRKPASHAARVTKDKRSKRCKGRHKSVDRNVPFVVADHVTPLPLAVSAISADLSLSPRSYSPLSTEICEIIGGDSRMHSSVGDFNVAVDDESSPHRSYSVPVSSMLDYCFDDLDVFAPCTSPQPNCSAADRTMFWERSARGDHLISGASFRPVRRDTAVVVLPSAGSLVTADEVTAHTPPSSQNTSPNFEVAFQASHSEGSTAVVDTPTSLVSGPLNDSFVDELFGSVCEDRSRLLDWECA